jgi:MarR family transcriptional regulator, transcriptional regulator for hemolysin
MPEMPDASRTVAMLVVDVSRLLRRDFARRAQHLGLTQAQWRALAYLSRNEGTTQASLAEMLEMQPISLARLLDRLVAAGWVERKPSPTDRRAYQLYLTPASEPVMWQLRDIGVETRDLALAGLDARQQEQLMSLLSQVKTNLQQATPKGADSTEAVPEVLSDAV